MNRGTSNGMGKLEHIDDAWGPGLAIDFGTSAAGFARTTLKRSMIRVE